MPRPAPPKLNPEDFSDSNWDEMSGLMEALPPDIDKVAADAIYDFKHDLEQFLEPLEVFSDLPEVQYGADIKEYDFVSGWFAKQRDDDKPMTELERLFGMYVGQVITNAFWRMGVGWTLDPNPESLTYLKPIVGPFAVEKPMKYVDPFNNIVPDWIDTMPMDIYQIVRVVGSWYQDAAKAMVSSRTEKHLYRKMNDILSEF